MPAPLFHLRIPTARGARGVCITVGRAAAGCARITVHHEGYLQTLDSWVTNQKLLTLHKSSTILWCALHSIALSSVGCARNT